MAASHIHTQTHGIDASQAGKRFNIVLLKYNIKLITVVNNTSEPCLMYMHS